MSMNGYPPVPAYWEEAERRKDEPLDEDLVPYLHSSGLGTVLQSPWVYSVPFFPQMAWRDNDQYHAKVQAAQKALDAGDWATFIFLRERPWRSDALWGVSDQVHGPAYWDLLRQVWIDSENIHQWGKSFVRYLLTRDEPGREQMMDEQERAALDAMAGTLTVYRGYHRPRGTPRGWSWTLDRDRAEWFARRLLRPGEKAVLATAEVSKANVIAYLASRGEEEIVADPRKVRHMAEVVLSDG